MQGLAKSGSESFAMNKYFKLWIIKMITRIEAFDATYRNPNLGLATKARACKVVGQENKLESEKKCVYCC
jgi:hypothetical protein